MSGQAGQPRKRSFATSEASGHESAVSGPTVQLCAFRVGDESYVVDIMRILEIIKPLPVTPVRRGSKIVEGVIDLRGRIIPVVDLRRRLAVDPTGEIVAEKQLIVRVGGKVVGFVVDAVDRVIVVPRAAIQATGGLAAGTGGRIFPGVVNHQGRLHILLNVAAILEEDADPGELALLVERARKVRPRGKSA